jgi:hypothetical protein
MLHEIQGYKMSELKWCVTSILILMLLNSCVSNSHPIIYDKFDLIIGQIIEPIDPVKVELSKNVTIEIDPKAELLSALQVASGYFLTGIRYEHFSYVDDGKQYFNSISTKNEENIYSQLSGIGFNFDAPFSAIIFLNSSLNIRNDVSFNQKAYINAKERAGGENNLNLFYASLKSFSEKTDFTTFYKNHSDKYQQVLNILSSQFENIHFENEISDYTRLKNDELVTYKIVVLLQYLGMGFGPEIITKNGREIYAFISPVNYENDTPEFQDINELKNFIRHEFCHSFTNKIVDKFTNKVDSLDRLFLPIKDTMQRQAYSTWRTCLYEHFVRAVCIRLAAKEDVKYAELQIKKEEKKGFKYIKVFLKNLETFENNQNLTLNLEQVFDNVLEDLSAL